jgi:hypothetical protein
MPQLCNAIVFISLDAVELVEPQDDQNYPNRPITYPLMLNNFNSVSSDLS